MGERVKGIMGSPFKRTSKYLTHQVFNRSVPSLRTVLFPRGVCVCVGGILAVITFD